MKGSVLFGAAFAAAGALALWSCGGGGGGGAASPTAPGNSSGPGPATVTVAIVGSIGNSAYRPNPVTANAGDTVMFKNNDAAMHHIVLDDGSADLGDVMPGATSRGLTLKNTSPTRYHCTVHPSMVGSINGQDAPMPPPCNDPYGYGC